MRYPIQAIEPAHRAETNSTEYLKNMSYKTLAKPICNDGARLNDYKARIVAAEQRIRQMKPEYQSWHGLSLDGMYPTTDEDVRALGRRTRLVEVLSALRTELAYRGASKFSSASKWEKLAKMIEDDATQISSEKGARISG